MSTMEVGAEAPEPRTQVAARRVRGIMAERRIKGREVAPALGISPAAFSRRSTGDLPFSLGEIEQLAQLIGVSEEYLLGFTDVKNPRPGGPDGGSGVVRHQGLEPRTRWLSLVASDVEPVDEPLADIVEMPLRRAA